MEKILQLCAAVLRVHLTIVGWLDVLGKMHWKQAALKIFLSKALAALWSCQGFFRKGREFLPGLIFSCWLVQKVSFL